MKRVLLLLAAVGVVATSAQAAPFVQPPETLKASDPLLKPTDQKPGREGLRKAIVDKFLKPGKTQAKPEMFLMGGGGASGKGVVKGAMIKDNRIDDTDAVLIDPDEIKESIPEYAEIVKKGDGRAAAVVHEESSIIAKEILAAAFAKKFNIVFDVTLGNPAKGLQQIKTAKEKGYKVILIGVTVEPAIAITRAVTRAKSKGRWVPVSMLLEAHKGFSEGFPQYVELVDNAFLFDTSKDSAHEVAVKNEDTGGKLKILDAAAYARFQKKTVLNVHAKNEAELFGSKTTDDLPSKTSTKPPLKKQNSMH